MATNALTSQLTLVELAKRTHDNKVQDVAEVLSTTIEVLDDAVWIECNNQTNHIFTQRLGLPAGSWRLINKGVSEEASVTKQIQEGTGMLEAYSTVDKRLVELSGNSAAFRRTEDIAFVEGMAQTFGTALAYGNTTTTPEQIKGWSNRLTATTYDTVQSASGTGSDLTSVWIVQWGPTKCHMIYPQGSTVGLKVEDLGQQTKLDSSDNPYEVYRTHFMFHAGFAVHDNRCYGRVANIETTGASHLFDPDLLVKIINEMIERASGSVIYMNSTVMSQADIQAMDKSNVYYTSKDIFGVPTTHFRGIPIRQFDSLTITEAAIS